MMEAPVGRHLQATRQLTIFLWFGISPLARSGCPQAQMDTTREGWGLVVGVFARRCVLRVDV